MNQEESSETLVSNHNSSIQSALAKVGSIDFSIPTQIYTLIFFISSLLITGYVIYSSNQSLQIPLIYKLNEPDLYANDPFGDTLPYYASMLWRVIALLVRVIPLEPLLLTLFLAERLLVIYAAGKLARTFAPNSQLACVGAMALFALAIEPILGSGTIVTSSFEQTGLSIAFWLLAIASFYQSRPILTAIWLGIGFNLNSMYGTYAITYLGAVFLLDSNYRQAWKKWLLCFGLFLLIASPAIFLTLSAFGRNAADNNLWLIASEVRFSYHLFPLTWDKENFGKFGILIFLAVAILYQHRHTMGQLFKHTTIWAGVSLLWLLYAFVAAYIAKSPSMLVMHPGRGTDLWYCFAAIALVSVLAVQLERARGWQRRSLAVAIFSASILIWNPFIGPYILVVCLIILTLKPVWYYLLGNGSTNRIALLLALWIVLVGWQNFHARLSKTKSLQNAFINRPAPSIEQVANWAKANTSQDAVFLVDLAWDEFRSLTKRSVFVTWKDGSAILWDRPYVEAWVERLKVLGLDITQKGLNEKKARPKLSNLYKKLQDKDVSQIKSNFPVNYWVVPVTKASAFPTVFKNKSYKVLEVK